MVISFLKGYHGWLVTEGAPWLVGDRRGTMVGWCQKVLHG